MRRRVHPSTGDTGLSGSSASRGLANTRHGFAKTGLLRLVPHIARGRPGRVHRLAASPHSCCPGLLSPFPGSDNRQGVRELSSNATRISLMPISDTMSSNVSVPLPDSQLWRCVVTRRWSAALPPKDAGSSNRGHRWRGRVRLIPYAWRATSELAALTKIRPRSGARICGLPVKCRILQQMNSGLGPAHPLL